MKLRMRTPCLLAFYVQYAYFANAGYKWRTTHSHIQAAGEPFGTAICGYTAKSKHVYPYDWADTKLGGVVWPSYQYRCPSCYFRTRQPVRVANWILFFVILSILFIPAAVLLSVIWEATYGTG